MHAASLPISSSTLPHVVNAPVNADQSRTPRARPSPQSAAVHDNDLVRAERKVCVGNEDRRHASVRLATPPERTSVEVSTRKGIVRRSDRRLFQHCAAKATRCICPPDEGTPARRRRCIALANFCKARPHIEIRQPHGPRRGRGRRNGTDVFKDERNTKTAPS
jgi:hypothetical protein